MSAGNPEVAGSRTRWRARPVFFLLALLTVVPEAGARPLNLGGAVDLSLSHSSVRHTVGAREGGQRTDETKASVFQHRYTLRGSGDLMDPRAGTYAISGTFLQEQVDPEWFQSAIGGRSTETVATDRRTNLYDYSLGLTLLPQRSPLTLFAQRVTREADARLPTTLDRRTVNTLYALDWDIPARRLPRLHLNLSQSQSETDATLLGPNIRTRTGSLDTDGAWRETRLTTRYQYADTEAASGATSQSQGANVTAERPLTETIRGRAYANYSTNAFSIGPALPGTALQGVSSFQENAAGLLLTYKAQTVRAPSLDGTLSYDYAETPRLGAPTLRRHLTQTTWNLRPEQRLDLFAGYRFFTFDVTNGLTTSHYLNGGAAYRPIFNLNTGVMLAYGLTDTSAGAASASNRFQNYTTFAQYLRTIRALRLGMGYTGNYNQNDAGPAGVTSRDLLNTVSGTLENTDIEVVHMALAVAFTDIQREARGTVKGGQQERRAQLNADSRYFRGILREEDQVLLFASARLANVTGQFGALGDTTAADARATYLPWQWLSVTAGYLIERFPPRFLADRDSEFVEAQLVYAVRRFLLTLTSRASEDRFSAGREGLTGPAFATRRALENRGTAVYQVGRLSLNLDYFMTRESRDGSQLDSDSVFLRAVRAF